VVCCGQVVLGAVLLPFAAQAQQRDFDLDSKNAVDAIPEFARQAGVQILAPAAKLQGIQTPAIKGRWDIREALAKLLAHTNLEIALFNGDTLVLREVAPPAAKADVTPPRQPQVPPPLRAVTTLQQPPPVPVEIGEIVVTGTRVMRDGYEAPTAVTIVGTVEIRSSGTVNIADFVNQLPTLAGGFTPATTRKNSSAGQSGLNTMSLRALGAGRTLVLLDGQRSVASHITGVVDINNFPQDLVSRVDVVTGGASAAYGSDALSGVVNFVLDKEYTGVKGEVSGGMTTYGDNQNWGGKLTTGTPFAGGRGHLLFSGEVSMVPGIHHATRDWATKGWHLFFNPAYTPTNGQPQLIARDKVGLSTATLGGIITNTALRGIEFGPGGVPRQHNMGTMVSDPFHVGGDWESSNIDEMTSLEGRLDRQSIFTRASYDIAEDVTVFAQVGWSHSYAFNYNSTQYDLANKNVLSGNPFIPELVQAQMTALGITQFTLGTMNGDVPRIGHFHDRILKRFVLGVDGAFYAFDARWTWDAYYQKGISRLSENVQTTNRLRYAAAMDAVRHSTTGAIVCRITLSIPNHPCVPWNVMGTSVNSEGAFKYIEGWAYRAQRFAQDVAAVSFNGEPFSSWAGPVSLAFGVEHRKEQVSGKSNDENLNAELFVGNYRPNFGSYSVTEGFVETVVPLANGREWAEELDLSAAVRATSYSTSGYVTTWKTGLTYKPVDDIRFRFTRSRDIRAPNLGELFQSGLTNVTFLRDPFNNNQTIQAYFVTTGNLDLAPEKADSIGIGAVFSPSLLPGFRASADYYRIKLKGGIGTFGAQATLDLCFLGRQEYCAAIDRGVVNGVPLVTQLRVQPFNFSRQVARGIDFEASYRMPVSAMAEGRSGELSFRALATRFLKNYSASGVPNDPPVDTVGAHNIGISGVPKWRYNLSAGYNAEIYNFTLTARGISAGVLDTTWIECQSGCPTSTINNRTTDFNHAAGALYFDVAASYQVFKEESAQIEMFLTVRNLANKDPALIPSGYTSTDYNNPAFNPAHYDYLGRVFRAGVRFQM
jgi:outer membrane receptor protein involved in Fe transport